MDFRSFARRMGRWCILALATATCVGSARAQSEPARAAGANRDSGGAQVTSSFRQVKLGAVVLSLPATASESEVPLWLHLHGAPAVVEANFAAAGLPGVLANLTLPGLSKVYADHFPDVAVFETLLRDIESELNRPAGGPPRRIGRLIVSSFSAGFGGVRQLLRYPGAFGRIDTLVLADSIYCGYTGAAMARRVDGELMSGFLRFAKLAAEGKKRMLISHSRQVPEGYASTTETADFLIRQLGGARGPAAPEPWPGGLRLLTRFSTGQFEVLGFDGEAAEDHMRHLRAIGSLLVRVR